MYICFFFLPINFIYMSYVLFRLTLIQLLDYIYIHIQFEQCKAKRPPQFKFSVHFCARRPKVMESENYRKCNYELADTTHRRYGMEDIGVVCRSIYSECSKRLNVRRGDHISNITSTLYGVFPLYI